MTNYNERLDEVFKTLNNKAREERASCTERNNWEGYNFAYERLENEAKQAITSLIKEQVAGAKKQMANNLIDQEIRLHKIYADDPNICVGVKLMADEVREYFDDGIYTQS